MNWLTTEQAMADYAYLITALKEELECEDSAVIAFGGSYGGMIASWFRMKYPNIVVCFLYIAEVCCCSVPCKPLNSSYFDEIGWFNCWFSTNLEL